MIIDYLPDGSPDCPLVRFYGIDLDDFAHLQKICTQLSEGDRSEIDLSSDERFEIREIVGFVLKRNGDIGATFMDGRVIWCLSRENWRIVSFLVDALIEMPASNGQEYYQWASGDLSRPPLPGVGLPVLISRTTTGAW